MSSRISYHLPRIRHQLGQPLRLAGRSYRVRGYLANRQATSLAHEPYLTTVLARAMDAHPGAFVDIGVNTGQTLLKMLTIDPGRAYVGFEPQIGCCFCVSQFLADNGLGHAQVLPMALSDRDGMLPLYAVGDHDEMASGRPRPGARLIHVVTRTGDRVLTEIGVEAPGVIKIDVEGAELEVLTGLAETLRRARPAVLFEVLPNFTGEDRIFRPDDERTRNRDRAAQVFGLLSELGYRIEQVRPDGETQPITGFRLDDRDNFVGRDYVAWPPQGAVRRDQTCAMDRAEVA